MTISTSRHILALGLLMAGTSAYSVQLIDPDTICETKTAGLAISSFEHCEKGDLVKIDSFELLRVCQMNSTIVSLQNEHLCTYRGSKREVRERPLSAKEKALMEDVDEQLLEKYSD